MSEGINFEAKGLTSKGLLSDSPHDNVGMRTHLKNDWLFFIESYIMGEALLWWNEHFVTPFEWPWENPLVDKYV